MFSVLLFVVIAISNVIQPVEQAKNIFIKSTFRLRITMIGINATVPSFISLIINENFGMTDANCVASIVKNAATSV